MAELTSSEKVMRVLDRQESDRIPHFGELKVYACPIGGTFFDELWLLMIGFDKGQQSNDY